MVPEHVVDGLDMIWASDLVISGGGTMNREAAALGVPVYSIFRGKIGAVDQYLSEAGPSGAAARAPPTYNANCNSCAGRACRSRPQHAEDSAGGGGQHRHGHWSPRTRARSAFCYVSPAELVFLLVRSRSGSTEEFFA